MKKWGGKDVSSWYDDKDPAVELIEDTLVLLVTVILFLALILLAAGWPL